MKEEIIIKPVQSWYRIDLDEIWRYRELLYFFTWRDLKVRYKQTFVGILWAVFQPFMTMVVFSIFFGNLAKMPSDGVPYPIFVYTGLLLWQFFASSLSDVSNCLINNQAIITKIYFPRLILPFSYIFTNFIDFLIAAFVLVILMVYYGFLPRLGELWILPILFLITFLSAAGIGLSLASVNVRYRDVRYILPYFIQLMFFITPVIYPSSLLGSHNWILSFNPMTGVISAARAFLFGTAPVSWAFLLFSGLAGLFFFITGIFLFKKSESFLADVI